MIKCEAVINFTLERFDEIKNIERKKVFQYEDKKLYIGDKFDCDEDLARYLTGDNEKKVIAVNILEVIPEEKIIEEVKEEKKEVKPKKSYYKKKEIIRVLKKHYNELNKKHQDENKIYRKIKKEQGYKEAYKYKSTLNHKNLKEQKLHIKRLIKLIESGE